MNNIQDSIYYNEINIESWSHFRTKISSLVRDKRWIIRGQNDANWTLSTSIERLVGANDPWIFEDKLIEKFKLSASNYYTDGSLPKNDLEWLSLMQHHGAPTRLLDWTFSPYVAAFFSLENRFEKCSVFAINFGQLITECTASAHNHDLINATGLITDTFFSKYFNEVRSNEIIPMAVPLLPEYGNRRLIVQQGLFLYPSHRKQSFIENLIGMKTRCELDIIKFNISSKIRHEALYDLQLMNVARASLFPDLDGLAKSLYLELSLAVDAMNTDIIEE